MKGKKIVISVIILLILIAALILAFLYFATDTFKTNKELFFKYLSNTQFIDNGLSGEYKRISEIEGTSNYSEAGNIICSASSNANATNIADIQQLFNVKYNRLHNKKLEQDYADFTLNTNNEDLITVRYLRDNKTYGVKLEKVLRKYIALENNNLKDFYSKLGISNLENSPEVIPNFSIKELLKLDEEQLNNIKSTYGNVLLNCLTEKNFSKQKNNDNTTVIKLSLTQKEFANILIKELETLKNDNSTLNLILNKANMAGYSLKIEDITNYLQQQINEINKNISISDKHFLDISITEKNKEVLKIDIVMVYDKNEIMEEKINNTKEEIIVSLDFTQNNKIVILYKDSSNTSKLDIAYGYETNKLYENVNMVIVDNTTKKEIGKCTIKNQIALNNNNIVRDVIINIYSEESKKTIQFNINDSKELKQDIQIEKITNQNAEIINNKTKEELQNLLSAIIARIQYVYGDKVENFSSIINNLGI